MKIRSIRLTAYGPFTDVTIDLPNSGPDFHMLFGPNEAGKSSALKAIRHMLFGIPAREPVNFLHGYPKLRVGARLVNGNGDEIEFLRRKGRAKTLRGKDDETVLDDDALAHFLGGVSPSVFEQMFAIGHDDLIQGGEEIISGKGNIGEALFAAGAGLIRLQNVQQDLESACGALFKPSGSTPSINQAIKAIKTARQEQKDALLLPKTWKAHNLELSDAQNRMDEVKATLGAHKQGQARLERTQEALPSIARKKEIDNALVAYRGVPDLADDFGDKRRDAEKDLKMATRDVARSRDAIEKISREIDALPVHQALLENAAAIESLQQELGGFRKAQKDRPGLHGRMRTLQKQASDTLEEISADISGEASGDFKLPPSTVGEIQELGKAYERLSVRQESAAEQQRKRKIWFSQLTDQRRAMLTPVDVSHLEHALQAAMAAGPIETQMEEMRTISDALEGELNRTLKRQALWHGSLADIDELPLPSKATIDRFNAGFDALQRALEKQREAKASTEGEIAQTQADIQAIDWAREVPTETDLKTIRALRDRGWGVIRQTLDGQVPPPEISRDYLSHFEDASDLPGAFEKSMVRADHVSDRLRREADQVSKKGLLEAQKEKLEKALSDVSAALETSLSQHRELETGWQQVWEPAGITPQTPGEMRGWLAEIESLRDKLADWRSRKRQSETLAARLAALKSDLMTALEAAGIPRRPKHPLSGLIRTAQAYIKAQRDLESGIATADKELIRLEAEMEEGASAFSELADTLSRWKTSWENSVKKIGIRAEANPTAALAVIESIREFRNKISEADVLRKRIDGIDRDSAVFTSRVDELVEALAPDLKAESRDRAAELLNGRLTHARKDESRHAGLVERLESSKKELEDAQRRLFECQALIESLCKAAHCANAELLAETEKRARERKALVTDLRGIEQQLRRLSAGATVDAFIDEASSMDADSIAPELQELDEAAQALEKERSALDQQIGALNARLEQMDGRSAAAMHAENAERLLADLESDVEKYARFKIASIILSRTVEQYREKHQGPLIRRASELFSQMTGGAFSRLRAEYDERGNPVLVGIRPQSDAQVTVDGMSDGTADQLYLSLRLASLEQYLEHNEPLPFVVDDILLRFDDERSLATLSVLCELSRKTQVIFFTHHRHLVELVEARSPDLAIAQHTLGSG
ncbi:AAA family ATPase [Desulfosarcina sp.]|uniref:AAA family ATPase n=1 Tax=Desulfosarcina sp. TaxID=2027861 RepID=UPI0029BC9E30|nr:AAA family ATPase [Desulfosarcina sp.]MDX2453051.1 AAA family ATPase [Desulfosarcina sp.]MDX2490793.1 AAA family ATPase [Desulfosarcina sp.]